MSDLKKKAREWCEQIGVKPASGMVEHHMASFEAGYREALGPLTQEEQSKLGLAVCQAQMGSLCACATEGTLPSREHRGCRARIDAAIAAFSCLSRLRIHD